MTFTIGVRELGGDIVEIPADVMHADREPINDVARNLERWVDAVVIRTFGQERLHQIAEITPKLHVINALSNEEHPCQALADMQTLIERWGSLAGRRIAFVGDGNNVCTSLVHAAMMLGIGVNVATPKGFELPDEVVDQAARGVAEGRRADRVHRSEGRRPRRRRDLHRRLDVDGPGSGIRGAQEDVQALPGDREP